MALGYRPEIDGLRAIAVIAVIINHINKDALPSGVLGVDVFFVISGYVITRSLIGSQPLKLGEYLSRFYARRIRRLLPALLVCIAVTMVFTSFFIPPESIDKTSSTNTAIASLFGLSNLYLLRTSTDYFASSSELNPFLHTWSLGVEEQFYFIFPLLLWGVGIARGVSRGRARKRGIYLLIATSVASLALYLFLAKAGNFDFYYLMPSRFWEIGLGATLCLVMIGIRPGLSTASRGFAAPLCLVLLCLLFFAPSQVNVPTTILTVLLTCLLLLVIQPGDPAYRLLTTRYFLFIGLISYSLYLWHFPVLSISRWTIGVHNWTLPGQVLLMFVLAWVSTRWIETPFRHVDVNGRARWIISIGILAAIVTAASFAVMRKAIPLYLGDARADRAQTLRGSIEGTQISPDNCSWDKGIGPSLEMARQRCSLTHPPSTASRRMFFLGDSHAWNTVALLSAAHRFENFDVRLWWVPGVQSPPRGWPKLGDYGQDISIPKQFEVFNAAISELKPGDVVVLSNYLLSITRGKDGYSSMEEWLKSLDLLAQRMRERNVAVIAMLPLPDFNLGPTSDNVIRSSCVQQWFRYSIPSDCTMKLPREKLIREIAPLASEMRRLEKKNSNLFLFDPFFSICPPSQQTCTNRKGGRLLYLDTNHLNLAGSELLVADFRAFLHRNRLASDQEQWARTSAAPPDSPEGIPLPLEPLRR